MTGRPTRSSPSPVPRRPLALALALVAATAWVTSAILLWQTVVPSGLELPPVELREHFTPPELERAEAYDRFVRIGFLLSLVVLLGALGLYAVFGPRFVRESAAGRIGTGMLLGMLGLAILWLVLLPFSIAELWWQRRHGLAEIGYVEFVLGNWLALGGEFLFISFALLVVMSLAGWVGERWWIPGGAVFVALALFFAFVSPYLIPAQERLRDHELAGEARALAREQGEREIPIYVEEVGAVTTAPNAEAAGIGPTRRVVLWDTLLDGRFGDDEVRIVVAHEIAHHSRDHLCKSVAWYALFAFPGAYVIARATRRRGGMREPRAVPLGLFVLVLLSVLALPLQNAFTRNLEAEADWVALETAEDANAARALFRSFSTTVRTDPTPPTWSYVLGGTHPSIEERLAMVAAWEKHRDGR